MPIPEALCSFALNTFVNQGVDGAAKLLLKRFRDDGTQLLRALDRSNRRAWKALEVALTGQSLWSRLVSSAEASAIYQQVRTFLDQMPLPELENRESYRRKCLQELKNSLNKGILLGDLVPGALLERVGKMAAHTDPQMVLQQEKRALHNLAYEVQQAGFKTLGWLLNQPAHASQSIVVVAVRFYFRREVETNAELARGLQLTAMESLSESQETAFRSLTSAFEEGSQRIEEALAEAQQQILGAIEQVRSAVVASGERIEQRLDNVNEDVQGLKSSIEQLLMRLDMLGMPVRAGHSSSIRNDRDRQLVDAVVTDYQKLSNQTKLQCPDLASDVGKLLMAAGQFERAEESFRNVAKHGRTESERAEAHYNAFRAALELKHYEDALRELVQAYTLDPEHFAPFPLDRYEPIRILGAGGFGVTFLSRHRVSKGNVAIKSLSMEEIDRDAGDILQEASALEQLRHPAVIGMRDCGYIGKGNGRPYLVMEYFDGLTLEQYVNANGRLALTDCLDIGYLLAEAIHAAHAKQLLHRDVKPANILLKRTAKGSWDARIIDFGLALKQDRLRDASTLSRRDRTLTGSSIAGTIDYAAPEQMGKYPGQRIGAPADVYGFGRTLNFALFGIPELTLHQYRTLPESVAEFLSHCVQPSPGDRPKDFTAVLKRLRILQAEMTQPSTPSNRQANRLKEETQSDSPNEHDRSDSKNSGRERSDSRRSDNRLSKRVNWEMGERDDTGRKSNRYHEQDDDRDDYSPRSRRPRISSGARIGHALLAFFFGSFAVHKFLQENSKNGTLRLLLILTCIGIYVNLFAGMIESVIYLTLSDEDYEQRYIVDKKNWF